MAAILGRSVGVVYLGVVMLLFLGSATPAFSLLLNSSNPLTCSSQCESKDCTDPLKLRYGKFCGVGYTGCSGQQPCDGLDTCCQTHDHCVGSKLDNYLNKTCSENLKSCTTNFKNSNGAQFAGANCSASKVEDVIISLMDVATVGSPGYLSSPINLHWAMVLVFILSALLL